MTEQELRTLTAAIILGGQYASGETARRDIEIRDAIETTDALLEALKDPAPLKKRLEDFRKSR